jgi:hypothetical protein
MLQDAARRFPDVQFVYSDAKTAFLEVTGQAGDNAPLALECTLTGDERSMFLKIDTKSGTVFGPQPFLAVRMRSGRYLHDNLDFDITAGKWCYTFDHESIMPQDLHTVGIAAADRFGATYIKNIPVEWSLRCR